MSGLLLAARHGAVLVLTLNQPAKRNALSLALRQDLLAAVTDAASDPAVRAIVLQGAGGHFCSGGDLTEMNVGGLAEGRARMSATHQLVRALAAGPKPVVAAVEGWAAGAGLSLALCADIVVAGQEARFAASFGNVGLIGDLGLLHTLPRRVGQAQARRMLLLGEPVDAATALQIGLADQVCEPGGAWDAAMLWADKLASRAPLPVAVTRALLSEGLESLLAQERDHQAALFLTEDHAEGKAAFKARRAPVFHGR